jgi:hypothetical protein
MRHVHPAPLAGLFAVAGLALAGPACAQIQREFSLTLYDQPDYRGASVTFYADNPDIGSTGFAARARSAQVRGTWRVCDGGGYRNRCEVLSANVRDLADYGLAGRVGSTQLLSGQPAATYAPAPAPPVAYAPPPVAAYPDRYDQGRDRYPPPRSEPGPYSRPDVVAPDYPPAVDAPPRPYGTSAPPYRPDDRGIEGLTAVYFADPTLGGQDVSAWSPRAADGFCRVQGLGAAIYFDQSRRSPRAVDPDGRAVGEGPVLADVLCRK